MSLSTRSALSLAVLSLATACGGADPGPSPAVSAASGTDLQTSVAARLRALAAGSGSTSAAVITITNAQFFQWVGQALPSIFPPSPSSMSLNLDGLVWDIRAYSNGNFLAVASNGRAYGLGPVTGNRLLDLGVMQGFSDAVCSAINCSPNTGGGGNGTLNECAMPASQLLQTGNRWTAVYSSTPYVPSASTGEYSVTGIVDGPASFEGQSTIKTSLAITGLQLGVEVNNISANYHQAAANGLVQLVGQEGDSTLLGILTHLKSVNTPPDLNSEFTLPVGGTLTKTVTATTSTSVVLNGVTLPPQTGTGSSTTTFKFEARESINVQGRSYDTCRYRQTDSSGAYTLQWHIVGKGFEAKFEYYTPAGVQTGRSELKGATFNGAPI